MEWTVKVLLIAELIKYPFLIEIYWASILNHLLKLIYLIEFYDCEWSEYVASECIATDLKRCKGTLTNTRTKTREEKNGYCAKAGPVGTTQTGQELPCTVKDCQRKSYCLT